MDIGLKNKAVLVTGGSRGIGASISLELGRLGADVAMTCRSRVDDANKVADKIKEMGCRSMVIQTDASVFDEAEKTVDAVVKEFGDLHALECNAGVT